MITESEKQAVTDGKGVIKNGRYFNAGKTYNSDGTLRYDFDAANRHDPWFNGDVFCGYDGDVPIWNKRT